LLIPSLQGIPRWCPALIMGRSHSGNRQLTIPAQESSDNARAQLYNRDTPGECWGVLRTPPYCYNKVRTVSYAVARETPVCPLCLSWTQTRTELGYKLSEHSINRGQRRSQNYTALTQHSKQPATPGQFEDQSSGTG